MKKLLLLCVAGLIVPTSIVLYATDAPPARKTGTVVILDNDRTLVGEVERKGDRFKIRRDVGELWIPTKKVKFLCKDWPEALKIMESRANLYDPDERLRLAKWCHQNELHDKAILHARKALLMRPKHYGTQQYLHFLEHAKKVAARPSAVKQTSAALPLPPSLDISADTLSMFTTKIQPILMNTCAKCHANKEDAGFVIMRASGLGSNRQRMTQYNMAAAVEQIDFHNAELSPLLIKAVSRHGNAAEAPLKSRSIVPYKLLRQWVDLAIANNPHLKEKSMLAKGSPIVDPAVKPAIYHSPATSVPFAGQATNAPMNPVLPQELNSNKTPVTPVPEPRKLPALPSSLPTVAGTQTPSPFAGQSIKSQQTSVRKENERIVPVANNVNQPSEPARTVTPNTKQAAVPVDEFDPAIFNQMFHGKGK